MDPILILLFYLQLDYPFFLVIQSLDFHLFDGGFKIQTHDNLWDLLRVCPDMTTAVKHKTQNCDFGPSTSWTIFIIYTNNSNQTLLV